MKSSFLKKGRHFLEAAIFQLFYGFFWLLPLIWASWVGGKFFRFLGPLTALNKRALKNLKLAFPERPELDLLKFSYEMWENLGRTLAEFPHMHQLVKKRNCIRVEGIENVDFLKKSKQGGFFFSAHLANWEISSLVAVQRGFPLLLLYRASNNPYINFLIQRQRQKCPFLLYAPKGKQGAKMMIATLKKGKCVGMLMDQKMNDGLPISFFGHPAWTAPALVQMARHYKTPIVPAQVIRRQGVHFDILYEPSFFVEETQDEKKDIEEGLKKINQIIERWIRENPGQWLWLHNRWG